MTSRLPPLLRGPSLIKTMATVGVVLAGCDSTDLASPTVEAPEDDRGFAVEVHQPASLAGLKVELTDHQGRPVVIECMTCHSVRDEYDVPDDAHDLESVHAGMTYVHGALSCLACHDPARVDRLRLADGTTLEMAEALRLCGQCHGVQLRDWENGSHGGMRGHWDRRMGPATRNHCIDCHDPHDPAFPIYRPTPPPRDRFLPSTPAGGHDG
jgi:hypothetical protein